MGGYETNEGKFFRGDHLAHLDESDIKLLEKMNIKMIVDYRSEFEQK